MAFDTQRVQTRAEFVSALDSATFHIILADYTLPSFDGISALAIARERCPEVPFIFASGSLGEEVAIETLKSGATDYVLKHRLARLVPSVLRALSEREDREQKHRAEQRLHDKEEELKAMSLQLWQAAKLATVGELTASIAHELNNPLSTVTLHVESLLEQIPRDDPSHSALRIVDQELDRMAGLVAGLLQFSRRAQAQFSAVDPCEEIGNSLGLGICRRIVEEHQGQLQILSEPGKGTIVRITLPLIGQGPGSG